MHKLVPLCTPRARDYTTLRVWTQHCIISVIDPLSLTEYFFSVPWMMPINEASLLSPCSLRRVVAHFVCIGRCVVLHESAATARPTTRTARREYSIKLTYSMYLEHMRARHNKDGSAGYTTLRPWTRHCIISPTPAFCFSF